MAALHEEMEEIVGSILADYQQRRDIDAQSSCTRPDKESVAAMLHKLERIICPGYAREKIWQGYNAGYHHSVMIEEGIYALRKEIAAALSADQKGEKLTHEQLEGKAQKISLAFFRKIPQVRALIQTDVQAAFEGDPAASGREEVIYAYPGIFAVMVQRMAHELYLLQVPLLPRMMTEYAHSITGIDIHPGAVIGDYFFIDHGTGVVVGETTVIGSHVRIYQGVTLGALTTQGVERLRGAKRHPTIEDGVTIYAGASILGGETVIGEETVVGSNAFITESVCPHVTVCSKAQELQLRQRKTET